MNDLLARYPKLAAVPADVPQAVSITTPFGYDVVLSRGDRLSSFGLEVFASTAENLCRGTTYMIGHKARRYHLTQQPETPWMTSMQAYE